MEQTPIDLSVLEVSPRRTLRVLLATTWDIPCGIAEHSFYLKEAVEKADPKIEVVPCPEALDPFTSHRIEEKPDLLHLNYHAALHSRWTPLMVRAWREEQGLPVVTTFHDTGVPNSDLCKAVCHASDAAVVHEPFDDLVGEVYYWRMGVPEINEEPWPPLYAKGRPYLGTVGFPFPWKCYDELCRVTDSVGWGLMLIAPGSTDDDYRRWEALNPWVEVCQKFTPRDRVVARLRGCDATAFTYVCHNTGQSGAILQGIAAKKPVLALSTCRQFRALHADALGSCAIDWCQTFEEVEDKLTFLPLGRMDPGVVALAHQDRWSELGKKYAALYRKVAAQP